MKGGGGRGGMCDGGEKKVCPKPKVKMVFSGWPFVVFRNSVFFLQPQKGGGGGVFFYSWEGCFPGPLMGEGRPGGGGVSWGDRVIGKFSAGQGGGNWEIYQLAQWVKNFFFSGGGAPRGPGTTKGGAP